MPYQWWIKYFKKPAYGPQYDELLTWLNRYGVIPGNWKVVDGDYGYLTIVYWSDYEQK